MSRSTMLRTRRKDINIKPNRRLDRKSSRGMIYENEELRLRTININADVEKGQSDIKKLRRENEQLRREIWFIRNEYEKLENKLLTTSNGEKFEEDGTENSTTCSSEDDSDDSSCPSCAALKESSSNETNSDQTYKPTNRRVNFEHLSIVSEEKSSLDESDQRPSELPCNKITNSVLGPDQSYPEIANNQNTENPDKFPHNFFSPLPQRDQIFEKTGPDLYVNDTCAKIPNSTQNSFQSGGNLDQLLQDMDIISKDILSYSNNLKHGEFENNFIQIESNLTPEPSPQYQDQPPQFGERPYKSEINVVLVPNPMPLLGFDKYKLPESITQQFNDKLNIEPNIFTFNTPPTVPAGYIHCQLCQAPFLGTTPENINCNTCTSLTFPETKKIPSAIEVPTEIPAPEEINSPKIMQENFPETTKSVPEPPPDIPKPVEKVRKNRKLSLHFPGSRKNRPESKHVDTPIPSDTPKVLIPDTKLDSKQEDTSTTTKSSSERKQSLTSNTSSLDKKHKHEGKKHKHELKKHRKNSSKLDLISSRSGNKHDSWMHNRQYDSFTEFTSLSERERTNSLTSDNSSRNSGNKSRKLSNYSTLNGTGKVPWCGCWGNGCL